MKGKMITQSYRDLKYWYVISSKTFRTDGISLWVWIWVTSHRCNQISSTLSEYAKLAFIWGGLCPYGLPRNVFQSPSLYVQQYAVDGVGLYSQQSVTHRSHQNKYPTHCWITIGGLISFKIVGFILSWIEMDRDAGLWIFRAEMSLRIGQRCCLFRKEQSKQFPPEIMDT